MEVPKCEAECLTLHDIHHEKSNFMEGNEECNPEDAIYIPSPYAATRLSLDNSDRLDRTQSGTNLTSTKLGIQGTSNLYDVPRHQQGNASSAVR